MMSSTKKNTMLCALESEIETSNLIANYALGSKFIIQRRRSRNKSHEATLLGQTLSVSFTVIVTVLALFSEELFAQLLDDKADSGALKAFVTEGNFFRDSSSFPLLSLSPVDDAAEPSSISRHFASEFKIEKDGSDPTHLLNVHLPVSTTNFSFRQFIARVVDVSPVNDLKLRDANRTFSTSTYDNSVINIHGLNPGHQYSIAIFGRQDDASTLIKEESIVMDPAPLVFNGSSSIIVTSGNVTIRATKADRALQDTFRVEYIQRLPSKRFPVLDIHDANEREPAVELFIGKLSPGCDFDVTITTVRNNIQSAPWRTVITTKPLRPIDMVVAEQNGSCLTLSWRLPTNSGADLFKIAYGLLHGRENMVKVETTGQQALLCTGIRPGDEYIFAVIAQKSAQVSDAATISHTVRPLPPRSIEATADVGRLLFCVRVELQPPSLSYTEKCALSILAEESGEHIERIVNATAEETTTNASLRSTSCLLWLALTPGRRYELSATAISGSAFSTKVFRSRALEPAFDVDAFRISIRSEGDSALTVGWPPNNDVAALRVADLWARLVGNASKLHIVLAPDGTDLNASSAENNDVATIVQHAETTPPNVVRFEQLRRGGCYQLRLYTLTESGIVSARRHESSLRLEPPAVNVVVAQVTRNSAVVRVFVLKSSSNTSSSLTLPSISDDCALIFLVAEASVAPGGKAEVVYDRRIPLAQIIGAPSIVLDGLRPFFNYSLNVEVICDSSRKTPLIQSNHELTCQRQKNHVTPTPINFATAEDRPGAISNFSASAFDATTLRLRWAEPFWRNGRITHYVINVERLVKGGEKLRRKNNMWIVELPAVDASNNNNGNRMAVDGSESILPVGAEVGENNASLHEALLGGVDGSPRLRGGQHYRITMAAATAAGVGQSSEPFDVEMPIFAPPRPQFRPEILLESVRATELSVRFNMSQLSAKNGDITKVAVIVIEQTSKQQKLSSDEVIMTWSQVQSFDVWPPYVALELLMTSEEEDVDNNLIQLSTKSLALHMDSSGEMIVTEVIGADSTCLAGGSVSGSVVTLGPRWMAICNGPLRPNTAYRFKLRVFTAPHLWSDSDTSDVAITEALKEDIFSTLGSVFAVLAFVLTFGVVCATLFAASRRRSRGRSNSKRPLDAHNSHRTAGRGGEWIACALDFIGLTFDCRYTTTTGLTEKVACTENHVNNGYHSDYSTDYRLNSASGPYHSHHYNHYSYRSNDNGSSYHLHNLSTLCWNKKDDRDPAHCNSSSSSSSHSVRTRRSNNDGCDYNTVNFSSQTKDPAQSKWSGGGWPRWHALKMMMAERAADCLAKLGLDNTSAAEVPASSETNDTTTASSANTSSPSSGHGNHTVNQTGQPQSLYSSGKGLTGGGMRHIVPPKSACATQLHPLPPDSSDPCGAPSTAAGGGSSNLTFNAHHRRSKSLRERTGVDQRLERLPSGPPGGTHKSAVLWTVVRPPQSANTTVSAADICGQSSAVPSSSVACGTDESRPVRIADFLEHVRLMSADTDFRFSEEYDDLRHVGVGQTCIAADLTVNRAKNRFTNILPYDHSRVRLGSGTSISASEVAENNAELEEDGSDYVNASYIPGFNSRHEFIAAQGPLPSTRDHFWRLVWEQQCPAIVALTKCVEKGRDKCHQYWPDASQRSVRYGDVEVTVLSERAYDEFMVRELRLSNVMDLSAAARTVHHLHYMAWPDFGVPDHPAGIVHFSRLFRNKLPPATSNRPTIVHCSAGVGRSGTFIALDHLTQCIECGRNIDVFGTVYEMRVERCHMVQNEQQYIFIHHCLQYVLENFYPHLVQRTVGGNAILDPAPTPSVIGGAQRNFTFSSASVAVPPPRIRVQQQHAEDDDDVAVGVEDAVGMHEKEQQCSTGKKFSSDVFMM